MSEFLKQTTLPAETPKNFVVAPSIDRWGSDGDGPLPHMISSVQQAFNREGLGSDTWMVISDASIKKTSIDARADALRALHLGDLPSRLFFLLPENQAKVAQKVHEKTGLPFRVIRPVTQGTGYGDHRETLDTLARAVRAVEGQTMNVVTFDDDMVIPEERIEWKPEALPDGIQPKPNSQVLHPIDDSHFPTEFFNITRDNKIAPLLDLLGKTVGEIRNDHPGMRATAAVKDTRSAALHNALHGHSGQFELTYGEGDDVPNSDDARIVATTLTKTKLPDYPTRNIAKAYLQSEFPSEEVPFASYRSGPSEIFAARGSNTIFPDSAVFARTFDEHTAMWRWWFVSSVDISLANKLKTVTGSYRADNDHLPILLDIILNQTGEQNMYASVDTEAYHSRARLGGNRQDMHEQAASSLVGNIAAVEATNRLILDKTTGLWSVNKDGLIDERGQPNDTYQAPYEHAWFVYNEMIALDIICKEKVNTLEEQKKLTRSSESRDRMEELTKKYDGIHESIGQKLGGFDFDEFYKNVSIEVRDQVLSYSDVVDAVPAVVTAEKEMIMAGEYPITEYITGPEKTLNFPSIGGKIK